MKIKDTILYTIILGLVVNLIGNLIWKYLPVANHLDMVLTAVLIIICALLLIFKGKEEKVESKEQVFKAEEELITGSEWNVQVPDGRTFKVKVLKNTLKTISFKMPLGTLDTPVERIRIVSIKERLIKLF